MDFIINLIRETQNTNSRSYLFGSYVYKKILKNDDNYDNVDILTNSCEDFYDKLKKTWNCRIINKKFGEIKEIEWMVVKCHEFDKSIGIVNDLYYEYKWKNNIKNDEVYDIQRLLYDSKNIVSFDKNMDVNKVIKEYLKGNLGDKPNKLRAKFSHYFNENNKKE